MRKAYVTVYFSLILSVCMGLFAVLFIGVRENAIRMRAREAMQVSMNSAFGEYNRYIWDHYKLIVIDSGFESNTNSMVVAEDHFTECMNKNFNEAGIDILGAIDLLKLHCSGTETDRVRFVTDDNCYAIKHQAVEYMKYKNKTGYIVDLYETLLNADEMAGSMDQLNEKYNAAQKELDDDIKSVIFEEFNLPDNIIVADEKGNAGMFSLLNAVIENTGSLSTTRMKKDYLFSERKTNEGNYGTNSSFSFIDKALLREYLLWVTSDYINDMGDSCMTYETEYLICGKDEDVENLESIANKILLIRECMNLASFEKDEKKKNTAEFLAGLISLLFMSPEIQDPVNVIITTAWVSWESMLDVKAIMAGEKRPLIKESSEWETDFNLKKLVKNNKKSDESGLGYYDYLRMLLLTESDNRLMERFANIIELNVRENTLLGNFRIDECFDAWEVTSYVESDFGYTYNMTRVGDVETY